MRKIFFTAVIFLLPMLLQAQENKLYGEQYIKAIADNTRLYVSKRPEVKDRLFRSEAVDKKIEEVKKLLKNNRYLAWMFENCFPNTLETTVHYRKRNGEDDTFVYLPCGFETREHKYFPTCAWPPKIQNSNRCSAE